MDPDTTRPAKPRVGAVIATDETTPRPNYVARCVCGWNAVTSSQEPDAAQKELSALVEAHRKVCHRRAPES